MMECSLGEFLTTARLGGLAVGVKRSRVIELIGEPLWWSESSDGVNRSVSCEYEVLPFYSHSSLEISPNMVFQASFDADDSVEALRLLFHAEIGDEPNSSLHSTLSFVDVDPRTVVRWEDFTAFLERNAIHFSHENKRGQRILMASREVVSKFGRRTHYQESMQAERPIRTKSFYLDAILAFAEAERDKYIW